MPCTRHPAPNTLFCWPEEGAMCVGITEVAESTFLNPVRLAWRRSGFRELKWNRLFSAFSSWSFHVSSISVYFSVLDYFQHCGIVGFQRCWNYCNYSSEYNLKNWKWRQTRRVAWLVKNPEELKCLSLARLIHSSFCLVVLSSFPSSLPPSLLIFLSFLPYFSFLPFFLSHFLFTSFCFCSLRYVFFAISF